MWCLRVLDLTTKLSLIFLSLSSISGLAGLAHSAVAGDADHTIESAEGSAVEASGERSSSGSEDLELIPRAADNEDDGVKKIRYTPEFFSQYNPVNAGDMVNQVPGFRLDSGGDRRGFGGVAGNALINGARPTTKDDDVGEILKRIPASQVDYIDLVRGETGGLNLRGQSVVVNIMLKDDSAIAVQWEGELERDMDDGVMRPGGTLSFTGSIGSTQYSVGLEAIEKISGEQSVERLLTGPARVAVEDRFESKEKEERDIEGSFNIESKLSDTIIHVNGRIQSGESSDLTESRREPVNADRDRRRFVRGSRDDSLSIELGGDIRFPITEALTGKGIALFNYSDSDASSFREIFDAGSRIETVSRAPKSTQKTESIVRLEFDWKRFSAHHLEVNLEGAVNTLENSLTLLEGDGDEQSETKLPGANTKVEEVRGDFEISDTWTIGDFVVDSALAAEISTITQSGDGANERSFFFMKPRLFLTYAPDDDRQVRLQIQRTVAQLDFDDFVSSTDFEDEQFDLGNPELSPEITWETELTLEQRFGEIGQASLTGFYNAIEDVQDKLPLTDGLEVPGNIGDARRWGVRLNTTLPLDAVGIAGGRVDIRANWQDSTVQDPVTGRSRILSDERRYRIRFDFRQDLPNADFAWGWDIDYRSDQRSFGLDEFEIKDKPGVGLDLFVETTRWQAFKVRLFVENITNQTSTRDRLVYEGARMLTPLDFSEVSDTQEGPRVGITVSGEF